MFTENSYMEGGFNTQKRVIRIAEAKRRPFSGVANAGTLLYANLCTVEGLLQDAIEYRTPAIVNTIVIRENGDRYSKCPKCMSTLDRDYQSFCDRCGQALDWETPQHFLVRLIFA